MTWIIQNSDEVTFDFIEENKGLQEFKQHLVIRKFENNTSSVEKAPAQSGKENTLIQRYLAFFPSITIETFVEYANQLF